MTRESIIEIIAVKAEMSKKQASIALNATLDGITESLQAGEKISFIGFGTFDVTQRQERIGVNPRTKEKITIAATRVPVFRAGTKLKDIVNSQE